MNDSYKGIFILALFALIIYQNSTINSPHENISGSVALSCKYKKLLTKSIDDCKDAKCVKIVERYLGYTKKSEKTELIINVKNNVAYGQNDNLWTNEFAATQTGVNVSLKNSITSFSTGKETTKESFLINRITGELSGADYATDDSLKPVWEHHDIMAFYDGSCKKIDLMF